MSIHLPEWLPPLLMLLCVLGTAVLYGYQFGRKLGWTGKHKALGMQNPWLQLNGTLWEIEFEELNSEHQPIRRVATLRFHQNGSSFAAEGATADGDVWSLEGVVHERQLCCLYCETNGNSRRMGALMAQAMEEGRTMGGMRGVWSEENRTLLMQNIKLRRLSW